jgi:hypothetical protein
MPGIPGMPGTPGMPGSADGPGTAATPGKGMGKVKPRFEFVIVFVWKEPTPSDKLRPIKKIEAPAAAPLGGPPGGGVPPPAPPPPANDGGGGIRGKLPGIDD